MWNAIYYSVTANINMKDDLANEADGKLIYIAMDENTKIPEIKIFLLKYFY